MNQKPPNQDDLIELGDETFDRMEGDLDPETIEMMRALWRLSIELPSATLRDDVPGVLH